MIYGVAGTRICGIVRTMIYGMCGICGINCLNGDCGINGICGKCLNWDLRNYRLSDLETVTINNMRILFSGLFLLLTFICFGQTPSVFEQPVNNNSFLYNYDSFFKAKEKAAVGRPFPQFAANNGKETINNKSLKGKVVLINFWFEGCHPCLAEFDALNELYVKLKGNKDFELISFTWDNAEAIKRVKGKFKLQFKVFPISNKECYRLNQNNGFPTSLVLNRSGRIAYLVSGGNADKDKAREFVMTTLLSEVIKEL